MTLDELRKKLNEHTAPGDTEVRVIIDFTCRDGSQYEAEINEVITSERAIIIGFMED